MISAVKKLGPGLLFAGAAIGVSHLVYSTRAGANFGFGLLWALLAINIVKYPFFQFGPRYAAATGKSLLDGYQELGKGALIIYFIVTFATMFTIQTAVTIVTASLASELFGGVLSNQTWCMIITGICLLILIIGRYRLLDNLMKIIIITLTITTILAVLFATGNASNISFEQIFPVAPEYIIFLVAFMGWMPAPLDISIWHSLWALEKNKITEEQPDQTPKQKVKNALFDFNIGYVTTIILGVCFLALGALVMYNSGEVFSDKGTVFSKQLISLYTSSLGNNFGIIIAIAAFTTMFSTTLTTLDASPRAMAKTSTLLAPKLVKHTYIFWMGVLVVGTLVILFAFTSEMGTLIKIATILSFLTAPFYAIINYLVMTSKKTPEEWRPSLGMKIFSISGIIFLVAFSVWYLTIL